MPAIVSNPKGLVQAWRDPDGICHLVFYSQEPNKLACKATAMWQYRPKFVPPDEITCEVCMTHLPPPPEASP